MEFDTYAGREIITVITAWIGMTAARGPAPVPQGRGGEQAGPCSRGYYDAHFQQGPSNWLQNAT